MVVDLEPRDLIGWKPANPLQFDKANNRWVEDIRYRNLADYHGHKIMRYISKWLGWSNVPNQVDLRIALHEKRQDGIWSEFNPVYVRENPIKPNGYAIFKRYVQLAPCNYHANNFQFYIESYFEGADASDDDEDELGRMKPHISPIVQPNEMVTFVGIFCGLGTADKRETMLGWNSRVDMLDEDLVYAHHDHINQLIHNLRQDVDVTKFSNHRPFVHVDDSQIRYRVQLPRQPLDVDSWNDHLDVALESLLLPVIDAFSDVSKGRVKP